MACVFYSDVLPHLINTSPILKIILGLWWINVQSLSLETLSSWLQILSEASLATVALHTYGLWG